MRIVRLTGQFNFTGPPREPQGKIEEALPPPPLDLHQVADEFASKRQERLSSNEQPDKAP
jgi:hypothetical protein